MTTSIDYSNSYTATLIRQQPTDPWGVRIRGGSDTGEPPTIYQIRKKSPASKAGVKEGDFLKRIDDTTTDALTHQQITDLLNTTTLTLEFTLTRNLQPELNGKTYSDDVTTSTTAQTADDQYNFQSVQTEYTRVRAALDSSKKREAIYRLAHRVETPQTQVKSYQPYNMLGQSSTDSQKSAHRHVYQVPVASVVQQETLPSHIMWTPPTPSTSATAAAAAVLSANLSDACNLEYANNNASFATDLGQYSVELIPPTALPSLPPPSKTGKKRQKRYEDTDLSNFEPNYGPPRQSRSFTLIETALGMQGAGETGLPPPRSATMELQRWEDQHRYYPPETFEHHTSDF